jgi:hypothetical protein
MDEEEAPIPQEDIAPAALPPYDLSGALKESNNTSDNSTLWMQPQPPLPQPQQQDPFAAQNLVAESAKQQAAAVVKNMKSGLDAEVAIPRKLKAIISFAQVLSAFFTGLAAVLKLIASPPFAMAVVSLYLFFFGMIICGFELGYGLKAIAQAIDGNCGFMQHAGGRCGFLMLVGMMTWAFGLWGQIASALCYSSAALNIYAAISYQRCCQKNGETDEKQTATPYMGPGSNGSVAPCVSFLLSSTIVLAFCLSPIHPAIPHIHRNYHLLSVQPRLGSLEPGAFAAARNGRRNFMDRRGRGSVKELLTTRWIIS